MTASWITDRPAEHASLLDPGLRLSDADRSEVAERLSQHYADGRLDHAELDERLDRAMGARTVADLDGIFAGLPTGVGPTAVALSAGAVGARTGRAVRQRPSAGDPARRASRPQRARWLLVVAVLAAIAGQLLDGMHGGWWVIALVAILWVRHRRHVGARPHPPGSPVGEPATPVRC